MSSFATEQIAQLSQSAAFNRWAGFQVQTAQNGHAVIEMPWRAEAGQYSGFLHAGLISALLDTVCGFAAVSQAGMVMTSQLSVSFLSPAAGEQFRAEADIIKAGRRQVFADARLFALQGERQTLVAMASAVMIRIDDKPKEIDLNNGERRNR